MILRFNLQFKFFNANTTGLDAILDGKIEAALNIDFSQSNSRSLVDPSPCETYNNLRF